MKSSPALSASGFGNPWGALCAAFALHIIDEASTGFLAVYNPTVTILRQRWSWFPVPVLGFGQWLLAMVIACALLISLTPVAARGMQGLRPIAWTFALVMFANSVSHTLFTILGHTVAAVSFARPAPGFYSSPLLLIASVWLMFRLRRTARVDFQLPSGY